MSSEEFGKLINDLRIKQGQMEIWMQNVDKTLQNQQGLLESIQDIALAVRDLANEQTNTSKEVACLRRDVDEIKSKPGKRWDLIVASVISVAVTAILMKFLT